MGVIPARNRRMNTRVYLDYNATAPLRDESRAAMIAAWDYPANASSIHSFGRAGRKLIENARAHVGHLVEAAPSQVIFNSGATEGNNTILRAFSGQRMLISAGEHSSVYQTGLALGAETIPLTSDGRADLSVLETLVQSGKPPALISVMLVNNETGVINPVHDIAQIAKKVGAFFHVDAVQAVGKIPVHLSETGADFMTLSAHKIGGPQGVGALVFADNPSACVTPPVLLLGGGQERGFRAGTENIAGIAGFGAAALTCASEQTALCLRLEPWRNRIETILTATSSRIQIHGHTAPRVSNTIAFSVSGIEAQTLLIQFDLNGIALSSGSACSSGKVKTSHVLSAMGLSKDQAQGALRLSMGYQTTLSDIETFIKIWQELAKKL